jgi:hypothetical protein
MTAADSGGVHEFSRAIGALEASFKDLTKAVDREAADAVRHREGLCEVLSALTESVRVLTDQNERGRGRWAKRWEWLRGEQHERAYRAEVGAGVLALWDPCGGGLVAASNWAINHWKQLFATGDRAIVLARWRYDRSHGGAGLFRARRSTAARTLRRALWECRPVALPP